jgi:hypothetical protein
MNEDIAPTLLGIVHRDLLAISDHVREALEMLEQAAQMIDQDTTNPDDLAALLSELDGPEVTAAAQSLRELAAEQRETKTLYANVLRSAADYLAGIPDRIATREAMLREHGYTD